jgi:hypothetical protein
MSAKKTPREYLPLLRLFIALLPLLGATSCQEDENIRLTSRERIQVDTLSSKQIDSLRPYMDSICATSYQGLVKQALDSLLQVRREEEAKLRARILQQQRQQLQGPQ